MILQEKTRTQIWRYPFSLKLRKFKTIIFEHDTHIQILLYYVLLYIISMIKTLKNQMGV